MSISVIPRLASSASPASSISNTGQADSTPIDFASLLFSELQSLAEVLPGLGKDLKSSMEKASEENGSLLLDPSLLASFAGNLVLPPEITALKSTSTQALLEQSEKGALGTVRSSAAEVNLRAAENADVRSPTQPISTIAEKFSLSGFLQGAGNPTFSEAANFAAETDTADTNASPLPALAGSISGQGRAHTETNATGQTSISAHLNENTWPQQFSEKMVWLAKNDQQSAQISINPPQLGPVQITLNLNGDMATMSFASPHAEVRHAIEGALPHLKEMLSSAGISLGQTNVGANMAQQNPENPFHAPNGKRVADENDILPANDKGGSTGLSQVLQKGRGLVDLFA